MTLLLYAGSSRCSTSETGRLTRHSFSFGPHLDPSNLGFGPMICHNDDLLEPGAGYRDHPHTDLEIVTWVLEGVLIHTDDRGNSLELRPGDVQVMSAGSGVRHAEMADAASGPTRFLQTWIRPDEPGTPPRWRVEPVAVGTELTTVVGGDGLDIGTRGASLHIARLTSGSTLHLPTAEQQHVFIARGSGRLHDLEIGAGDAVRLTDELGREFEANANTELLVWTFTA